MNETSIWNGYTVHGDVKELDKIITESGTINLDGNDIICVLSAEGENWISAEDNINIGDAFKGAVSRLPFTIDKANYILIDFRCGSKKPDMSEFSIVSESLSKAIADVDVIWGMSNDDTLGEKSKVVLVVSAQI